MDNPTAPAGIRTQISLVSRRTRLAIPLKTVIILARTATLLAIKPLGRSSPDIQSLKSALRGMVVGLFFTMGMTSLPVEAITGTADPINHGIQIPGQSSGAFPPVPDALWLLGFVLIALIIIARRRFK
jgi:hypothetical protein